MTEQKTNAASRCTEQQLVSRNALLTLGITGDSLFARIREDLERGLVREARTHLNFVDIIVNANASVGLADCLAEINNALNYWYPLKGDASEDECNARHVRLFQFRDRLAKQLKFNAFMANTGAHRT